MRQIIGSGGVLLVLLTGVLLAQQRFGDEYRRFKGFTKSPNEHIMNEYEGTPELQEVRGQVIEASSGVGVPDAVFEIRSEDPDAKVSGTKTDSKGRFHLGSVRDGVYVFKVTRDGFQSVFGKLKVNRHAQSRNRLQIELKQGV